MRLYHSNWSFCKEFLWPRQMFIDSITGVAALLKCCKNVAVPGRNRHAKPPGWRIIKLPQKHSVMCTQPGSEKGLLSALPLPPQHSPILGGLQLCSALGTGIGAAAALLTTLLRQWFPSAGSLTPCWPPWSLLPSLWHEQWSLSQ